MFRVWFQITIVPILPSNVKILSLYVGLGIFTNFKNALNYLPDKIKFSEIHFMVLSKIFKISVPVVFKSWYMSIWKLLSTMFLRWNSMIFLLKAGAKSQRFVILSLEFCFGWNQQPKTLKSDYPFKLVRDNRFDSVSYVYFINSFIYRLHNKLYSWYVYRAL